jgi:RNA polymerase sigma-70 factor (sigma-E family)
MTATWQAGRHVPGKKAVAAGAAADPAAAGAAADGDADRAVTELYAAYYRPLVQLAALLVGETATAEDVVQDSFVAMRAHWRRLRDSGKAAAYLRQCVVNGSRSVLRRQRVADRNARQLLPDMPSAEEGALALLERSAVVAALHALPARQREVVVLRYYADLSGPQIASVMGITQGSVKSHHARALQALRRVLGREEAAASGAAASPHLPGSVPAARPVPARRL